MKIFKRAAVLVIVAAMALSLSACGETMDAKTVAEKMAAAYAETPMTEGDVYMEMPMSMQVEDMTMDMDTSIDMDVKISYDPYAMYSETEMTMTLFGQEINETMYTYSSVENDKVTTYTNSGESWTRQDMGVSPEEFYGQGSGYAWLADKAASELTLEKETQTVDDQKVYVLKCTLTGEEMQSALNSMGGADTLLTDLGLQDGAIDLSSLNVPTVFYIDTNTFLPVKIEMTISGLSDIVNSILGDSLGDLSGGMTFTIGDVLVSYSDLDYDPVEVPSVPIEGIQNSITIA